MFELSVFQHKNDRLLTDSIEIYTSTNLVKNEYKVYKKWLKPKSFSRNFSCTLHSIILKVNFSILLSQYKALRL